MKRVLDRLVLGTNTCRVLRIGLRSQLPLTYPSTVSFSTFRHVKDSELVSAARARFAKLRTLPSPVPGISHITQWARPSIPFPKPISSKANSEPWKISLGECGLKRAADHINKASPGTILLSILAINCMVFALWLLLNAIYKETKIESIGLFCLYNLALFKRKAMSESLLDSHPWSIVTSCLSHIDMQHLACNMFLLAVLSPMAFRVLTNSQYLSVYVGSGIAGNLAALINNTRYIDPTLGNQPFLFVGASGAVLGIMAFSAAVLAKRLSPMVGSALLPWSLLAAQLISEGYKARTMPEARIGHAAHVGGALTGTLAFVVLQSRGVLHRNLRLLQDRMRRHLSDGSQNPALRQRISALRSRLIMKRRQQRTMCKSCTARKDVVTRPL